MSGHLSSRVGLPSIPLPMRDKIRRYQRRSNLRASPERLKERAKKRRAAKPLPPTPSEELDRLRQNLNTLPQELEDMIFDFTFSSSANAVIRVEPPSHRGRFELAGSSRFNLKTVSGSLYLAPNLMQVSSATWALYSSSYYENTTFLVHNPNLCQLWISSMPLFHKELLRKVVCRKYKIQRQKDALRVENLPKICSFFGMSALSLEFVDAIPTQYHNRSH